MCPLLYWSLAEPDSAFAGTAWKAVTQGEGAEVCARSAKTKLSKIISQATRKAPLRVLPWPTKSLLQSTAKHTDVHSPPAETICTVNRTWSGGESNAVNVQELQVLNLTLHLTMQSLFLHRLAAPPQKGSWVEICDLAGPWEPPWEERPKTRNVAKIQVGH